MKQAAAAEAEQRLNAEGATVHNEAELVAGCEAAAAPERAVEQIAAADASTPQVEANIALSEANRAEEVLADSPVTPMPRSAARRTRAASSSAAPPPRRERKRRAEPSAEMRTFSKRLKIKQEAHSRMLRAKPKKGFYNEATLVKKAWSGAGTAHDPVQLS